VSPQNFKPEDLEAIKKGLAAADAYFEAVLGVTARRPVTIRATGCPNPKSGNEAGDSFICFNTANANWAVQSSGPTLPKIAAHERFHNLQSHTGCLPGGFQVDQWLTEGAAEYFGYTAAVWAGLLPGPLAARVLTDGRGRSSGVQLSVFELQVPGGPLDYGMIAAAVGFLLEGRPATTWTDYCKARGEGLEWRAAFQRAFGMTTAEFYTKWEAWVAAVPPATPTPTPGARPTAPAGAVETPAVAIVSLAAEAGAKRIEFSGIQFSSAPVGVRLNPGGANQENAWATGLSYYPGPGRKGYLLLDAPLKFAHAAGEALEPVP
jgi:hypothetical protein